MVEEELVPAPAPRPVIEPAGSRAPLVRVTQMIWFLFSVLEALLGLRFVLKLVAANPDTGFTRLVYGITDVFMAPFAGLTAEPAAGVLRATIFDQSLAELGGQERAQKRGPDGPLTG